MNALLLKEFNHIVKTLWSEIGSDRSGDTTGKINNQEKITTLNLSFSLSPQ